MRKTGKLLRRALALILCAALLGCSALCFAEGEDASDAAVTEIADAQGMLSLAADPAGNYRLTADIDMSSLDWKPLPFTGTFDGNGHTLYNLNITQTGDEVRQTCDGNRKPYDTVFAGLFSTLEGAAVRDLTVKGALVTVESDTHCFSALLAGYIYDSDVTGCTIEGRVRMIGHEVMVGTGGLAGYGYGRFADCEADVELVFEDRCLDKRCEQFMGGVLACGMADIERCVICIRGYDSCHGYVHNGGLMGLYFLCGMSVPFGTICENYVVGRISFFEDNRDRRAYCEAFRGESLSGVKLIRDNMEEFERDETKDYSVVLGPEACETPDYIDEVTPFTCEEWGFTHHCCSVCGYEWTDSYTPPGHVAGDWVLETEPGIGTEGIERRRCTGCGLVMDERSVEALVGCESCSLDQHEIALKPGERCSLHAEVTPDNAAYGTVVWTSSDRLVAFVGRDGLVTGVAPGQAVITAETADGLCLDRCTVTVRYGFFHWLYYKFLADKFPMK